MLRVHHPSAVIPAKAGTHPGLWRSRTSDTTCVGQHFSSDAWMGPRLRGGDELGTGGFVAALMIFSEVLCMRYLPLEDADRREMLARIGVKSIDDLFVDVPQDKLLKALPDLPRTKGEMEVERELGRLAARNTAAGSVPFFVGAGAYRHHVPATVDHLIQRSEFLTSYTPYQPEITQGTLQYLFEFQTQVAMLTGMDVANASMYDGSTACGRGRADGASRHAAQEGRAVGRAASAVSRRGRDAVALRRRAGRCADAGPEGAEDIIARIDAETSCVVVQYPSVYGHIRDLQPIAEAAHAKGALLVVGRDRGRGARRHQGAGRDGRRHRRRRGPVDRQRLELRRALRRPVCHAREVSCARCRAGSPARRSMPRAGAASC